MDSPSGSTSETPGADDHSAAWCRVIVESAYDGASPVSAKTMRFASIASIAAVFSLASPRVRPLMKPTSTVMRTTIVPTNRKRPRAKRSSRNAMNTVFPPVSICASSLAVAGARDIVGKQRMAERELHGWLQLSMDGTPRTPDRLTPTWIG